MIAQRCDVLETETDGLAATKLGAILSLSDTEREVARNAVRGIVRTIKGGHDVLRQGSLPQHAIIILEGWAAISRTLSDGRRQMQAVLLPTDFYDIDIFSPQESDHALTAIGPLSYIELRRERLRFLADEHPRIAQALWRHDLRFAALQREWIVSLGCRTALERVAYLFCELYHRLSALGRVRDCRCDMPFTQSHIAEATGLTPVHVNRILQKLRASRLIAFGRRELIVRDISHLEQIACLSPRWYSP